MSVESFVAEAKRRGYKVKHKYYASIGQHIVSINRVNVGYKDYGGYSWNGDQCQSPANSLPGPLLDRVETTMGLTAKPAALKAEPTDETESQPTENRAGRGGFVGVAFFCIVGVIIIWGAFNYLSSGPTHDADWCDYQNDLMAIEGGDGSGVDRDAFLKYCVNGTPEE